MITLSPDSSEGHDSGDHRFGSGAPPVAGGAKFLVVALPGVGKAKAMVVTDAVGNDWGYKEDAPRFL